MQSKQEHVKPLPNPCFRRGVMCCHAGVMPAVPSLGAGARAVLVILGRGFPQQDPPHPGHGTSTAWGVLGLGETIGQAACKANVKCTEKSLCQPAPQRARARGEHGP